MYQDVLARIDVVLQNHDRSPPVLIAVSKNQGQRQIEEVLEAGERVFGENRVQEAFEKWPDLERRFEDVTLHLLGPLQSNKIGKAIELFDYIHTLDRMKLAHQLARMRDQGAVLPKLFVQVNIGHEMQKTGVDPTEISLFFKEIRPLELPVIGLMCIPPAHEAPRPYFQKLRHMAHDFGLESLSMGMSDDFEIAIEEGATHIRVGSAIFGARAGAPISR